MNPQEVGYVGMVWRRNMRGRDHWEGPDVYGRIILKWILRKWDMVVWAGFSWLRIQTGGGHL
jgi:hypothetical protein